MIKITCNQGSINVKRQDLEVSKLLVQRVAQVGHFDSGCMRGEEEVDAMILNLDQAHISIPDRPIESLIRLRDGVLLRWHLMGANWLLINDTVDRSLAKRTAVIDRTGPLNNFTSSGTNFVLNA